MSQEIVLFGAGAAGRYALKYLREQGVEPVAFCDSDVTKWGTEIFGTPVIASGYLREKYPNAEWVATAISRPAALEIREVLKRLGVATKPLWECIPVCHELPSVDVMAELLRMCPDRESHRQLSDQYSFRKKPDYDFQMDPTGCDSLYFPEFILHRDDEVFIDCGAADGDTLTEFLNRWPRWKQIIAFEPDTENYSKLLDMAIGEKKVPCFLPVNAAVGDVNEDVEFLAAGDYSSHLESVKSRDAKGGEPVTVACTTLDSLNYTDPPTYIKMDIEGAELKAIWGARHILKEHAPALAICAYHTSDHLWQIPMLIKALQPEYKMFFRRYAEGAFEIVWYAVPPERVLA